MSYAHRHPESICFYRFHAPYCVADHLRNHHQILHIVVF